MSNKYYLLTYLLTYLSRDTLKVLSACVLLNHTRRIRSRFQLRPMATSGKP